MCRFVLLLLLALATLAWSGGMQSLRPTDRRIYYSGRTLTGADGRVSLDWACSAVSIVVSQTSIVSFVIDGGSNYFAIFTNDTEIRRFEAVSGKLQGYSVTFQGRLQFPTTVTLLKLTEPEGYHMIKSFDATVLASIAIEADAQLKTFVPRPLRIEFIGDSDLNGAFVLGAADSLGQLECVSYAARYQSCERGFGYKLGTMLDAEVRLIAASGRGVLNNAGPFAVGTPMLQHINRTLFSQPLPVYRGDAWLPDLVVIMLGSNDFIENRNPNSERFIANYRYIFETIAKMYKPAKVPVLSLCGGETEEQRAPCTLVQRASDIYAAESDRQDIKFQLIRSGVLDVRTGDYGCLEHRSAAGQQKLAAYLAPLIRPLLEKKK